MLNVVETKPECKAVIKVCAEAQETIDEIDGVWEVFFLVEDALICSESLDTEYRVRLQNGRSLLLDLIKNNRDGLVSLMEQRRERAEQGEAA